MLLRRAILKQIGNPDFLTSVACPDKGIVGLMRGEGKSGTELLFFDQYENKITRLNPYTKKTIEYQPDDLEFPGRFS